MTGKSGMQKSKAITTDLAPSTGPAAANTQTASTSRTAALHRARRLFGFVPSLLLKIARSPAAANAYLAAMEALQHGALTEAEQHVVMLAVSAANESRYCMVAHSEFAQAAMVTTPDLDSVTALEAPSDMRLKALTKVTWRVIEKRGWLDDSDMNEFEQIGIERNQIYEIIAFIAVKTISNYIHHIALTQFEGSDE